MMTQLLNKILNRKDASKEDAKQRLKVLLIHDQVDLTPAQLDACRKRSPRSSKNVEIDRDNSVVRLERGDDKIALISSVPVRRVIERALLHETPTSPSPRVLHSPKSPKQHSGAAICGRPTGLSGPSEIGRRARTCPRYR